MERLSRKLLDSRNLRNRMYAIRREAIFVAVALVPVRLRQCKPMNSLVQVTNEFAPKPNQSAIFVLETKT